MVLQDEGEQIHPGSQHRNLGQLLLHRSPVCSCLHSCILSSSARFSNAGVHFGFASSLTGMQIKSCLRLDACILPTLSWQHETDFYFLVGGCKLVCYGSFIKNTNCQLSWGSSVAACSYLRKSSAGMVIKCLSSAPPPSLQHVESRPCSTSATFLSLHQLAFLYVVCPFALRTFPVFVFFSVTT